MNWRFLFAAAVVSGLLTTGSAVAQIRPHAFYLTPQAGGYFFHSEQNLKDAPIFGLGLGYHFSKNWSAEFSGSYVDTESEIGAKEAIDLYLARVGILYHFRPDTRLVPHLTIGAGGLLFDDSGGTDLDAFVDYGIGLEYFLTPAVSLQVQGRHMFTGENRHFDGKEFQNFVATAGVKLQFGGQAEQPEIVDSDGDGVIDAFDRCPNTPLGVPVDGYGCPADADRDGIADYLDRCPDTPAGAAVDQFGCPQDSDGDEVPDHLDQCPGTPAGQKVDQNGCPVLPGDSDGDGIQDDQDQCPGTPSGTPVNLYGCPIDSDGDGVSDLLDKCPGTPAGVPVDATGCARTNGAAARATAPAASPSLEMNLEFLPGQAALRPEFEDKLRGAVEFIRTYPGQRIIVEGHTDSVGPAESNLTLSQSRAENIRRYLVEKTGVPPQTIEAIGYGETRPVAENSSQAGRAQNRRVVVRLAD